MSIFPRLLDRRRFCRIDGVGVDAVALASLLDQGEACWRRVRRSIRRVRMRAFACFEARAKNITVIFCAEPAASWNTGLQAGIDQAMASDSRAARR